ncbi:MAG: NAD-dependent epimerase/dehydratase family protein [Bryobacterales bacterium]|nr:NAD-dependent epimerase/dehydratase family protein [Bryobacterales bacterium]
MNCLVIGGTGYIGRFLVAELLKQEHSVAILHRRAAHNLGRRVANITADRNDSNAIKAALAGKKFDVVFDNVYDSERGTTAVHIELTARACGDRLRRYIFMSSVAAYGDGLNHHEGDALAPDDVPDLYVRNKAMSERALFRLRQRIGLPVVTLRPPFVYGPGNPYYREAFFWDRLRAGRPIIVPGDGRRWMQFIYVKDLARAAIRSMEEPGAVGQAFNIANPRPISQIEAAEAFARAAKRPVKFVRIPREYILRAGGHPMGPKLYFGMYFDLPAITQVTAKAQRILKFKPTDFLTGLKETHRWYLRNNEFPAPDYTFEDSLIAHAPQIAAARV